MTSTEHEDAHALQNAKQEGSLDSYSRTLDELRSKSDEELRNLARAAHVDGVDRMDRDHLIAKLIEEPGANEL